MLREAPMLAGVTKTTAGNIQPTRFGRHGRADENHDERGKGQQSAALEKKKNQCDSAQDFQPRQKKCEPHAHEPRQDFKIVDVQPELDGVVHFEHAGVDEDPPNNQFQDSPRNLHVLNSSTPQPLNDSSSPILPSRLAAQKHP